MAAALTVVSKAIEAKIQQVSIPLEAQYRRSYGDFKELLEDTEGLLIDVIAEGYDTTDIEDRGACGKWLVTVAIAVRKRFTVADQTAESEGMPRINVNEIDALVDVVQKLNDYWMHPDTRRLDDDEYGLTWNSTIIVFACNRKMLIENHQFMGLIRLNYDAVKEL